VKRVEVPVAMEDSQEKQGTLLAVTNPIKSLGSMAQLGQPPATALSLAALASPAAYETEGAPRQGTQRSDDDCRGRGQRGGEYSV